MSLTYDNIRNCFPDSESTEWPWTGTRTVSRAAPVKNKKIILMPSSFHKKRLKIGVFQRNSSTFPIGKAYNISSTWNSGGKSKCFSFFSRNFGWNYQRNSDNICFFFHQKRLKFRVFQGNSSTFPIGKAYTISSTWNSGGKANVSAFSPGISVGIIKGILIPYVFSSTKKV